MNTKEVVDRLNFLKLPNSPSMEPLVAKFLNEEWFLIVRVRDNVRVWGCYEPSFPLKHALDELTI